MTGADKLLSRLAGVKGAGSGRWLACCPAHADKRPSLSIRETDDGRTLVHCFGGCDVDDVMHAVGLDLADLFPERSDSSPPLKRRALITASQAVTLIEFECMLVWTAAFNLANGHALTADDLDRLAIAGRRIQATIDEVRA